MSIDYANLPTPPACVADFCLIPVRLALLPASVSNEVAAVQRLMKASGLSYSMHSAGTTVEGSWDDVMKLIGQAHTLVHQNGVLRVQTDIRAGTRTDKKQHFSEKVSKVESILAADSSTSTKTETETETKEKKTIVAEQNKAPVVDPKPEQKVAAASTVPPKPEVKTWASMLK